LCFSLLTNIENTLSQAKVLVDSTVWGSCKKRVGQFGNVQDLTYWTIFRDKASGWGMSQVEGLTGVGKVCER
jgi:hypothetical protein